MKRHCFTLVPFFALIGLILSPLAAHTSSSSTGQSNEPIFTFYASIASVAFSPDGRLLVLEFPYDSSEFELWDVSAGRAIAIANFSARGVNYSWRATLSPDGQWLAGWKDDGTIELWDVSDGVQHRTTISAYGFETDDYGDEMELSFSLDGRLLASSGQNWSDFDGAEFKVWDVSARGAAWHHD